MDALQQAELLLLRRLGADLVHRTIEDGCRPAGVEKRWLKAGAIALLRALRRATPATATITVGVAVSAARAAIDSLQPPTGRAWARTAASIFKSTVAQAVHSVRLAHASAFRECEANTVHGVKGQGADAVLVVLSDEHTTALLEAWRARRTDDEASRVVYVGVTRAERLLSLAVPEPLSAELVGILRERSVDLEVAPVCGGRPTDQRRRTRDLHSGA